MQTRSINCMGTGTTGLGSGIEEKDLKIITKYRQNKSHHHVTTKKIQTPNWRNIAHQMRSNPSALLSTGRAPAPCPIWGAALALCEWKECRDQSDTQRARKHELWEQAEGNEVGWAIEEKPEIQYICPFRYRKDSQERKGITILLLFSKQDKKVPWFHCHENSDKTQRYAV